MGVKRIQEEWHLFYCLPCVFWFGILMAILYGTFYPGSRKHAYYLLIVHHHTLNKQNTSTIK
jgi:hypothetical protein